MGGWQSIRWNTQNRSNNLGKGTKPNAGIFRLSVYKDLLDHSTLVPDTPSGPTRASMPQHAGVGLTTTVDKIALWE